MPLSAVPPYFSCRCHTGLLHSLSPVTEGQPGTAYWDHAWRDGPFCLQLRSGFHPAYRRRFPANTFCTEREDRLLWYGSGTATRLLHSVVIIIRKKAGDVKIRAADPQHGQPRREKNRVYREMSTASERPSATKCAWSASTGSAPGGCTSAGAGRPVSRAVCQVFPAGASHTRNRI